MKMKTKIKLVVVLLGFIFLTYLFFPYWSSEKLDITVTDKERVLSQEGTKPSSKYLIFTETETFENVDCAICFKFNSSDLYGKFRNGETYRVKVYGYRVPFFSVYRNIVKIYK